MAAATPRIKKITVDIPQSLYKRAEKIVHERDITTSVFIRQAVENYLNDISREQLENELIEGYVANAVMGDEIHREFAAVDAEQA